MDAIGGNIADAWCKQFPTSPWCRNRGVLSPVPNPNVPGVAPTTEPVPSPIANNSPGTNSSILPPSSVATGPAWPGDSQGGVHNMPPKSFLPGAPSAFADHKGLLVGSLVAGTIFYLSRS